MKDDFLDIGRFSTNLGEMYFLNEQWPQTAGPRFGAEDSDPLELANSVFSAYYSPKSVQNGFSFPLPEEEVGEDIDEAREARANGGNGVIEWNPIPIPLDREAGSGSNPPFSLVGLEEIKEVTVDNNNKSPGEPLEPQNPKTPSPQRISGSKRKSAEGARSGSMRTRGSTPIMPYKSPDESPTSPELHLSASIEQDKHWSYEEHSLFLKGMRLNAHMRTPAGAFKKGFWNQVASHVTTRTNNQCKSHYQKVLKDDPLGSKDKQKLFLHSLLEFKYRHKPYNNLELEKYAINEEMVEEVMQFLESTVQEASREEIESVNSNNRDERNICAGSQPSTADAEVKNQELNSA